MSKLDITDLTTNDLKELAIECMNLLGLTDRIVAVLRSFPVEDRVDLIEELEATDDEEEPEEESDEENKDE